jgi:serine/threonine-protein kinase HipA
MAAGVVAADRDALEVFIGAQRVGRVSARRGNHRFEYDERWRSDRSAFPLSLSLPLTLGTHSGAPVTHFLRGLLPDNDRLLRQWGQRFGVSHNNALKLLAHVGHDCAGAARFLAPDQPPDEDGGVEWLDDAGLCRRIEDLIDGRADGRVAADEGQFSLAGAQYKTALVYDARKKRWGVPWGREPTTFIVKPEIEGLEHQVWNEHFCLRLAQAVGLAAAASRVVIICGHPVIVVERYDRIREGRSIRRVHQEDLCQALAIAPDRKYENEGGPGAAAIMRVLDSSEDPQADHERFLAAVLFNLLIGGTDAHAKNYSILWDRGPAMRLAPLYDVNSILPYVRPHGRDYDWQRVRSSMRIGSQYALMNLQARHVDRLAERCAWAPTRLRHQLRDLAERLIGGSAATRDAVIEDGAPAPFATRMREAITGHCETWIARLT